MDLGLAGRVYLLTGASRGLGFAAAESLVVDGARVLISARDAQRVDAAVTALNTAAGQGSAGQDAAGAGIGHDAHGRAADGVGRAAHGIAADLADADTPARLIRAARDVFGRIDGALVSVGGPPRSTAAQATDEQWRQAFESVFLGSVRMARAILAELEPGGAVGFVLSTAARSPRAGLGLSNGLRPGLAGVAKDMADEYGPRGLRVFSLLPHRMLTDRYMEAFGGDAEAAAASADDSIPLRRIGEPAEFGRVAAFLLSPAASYLTGLAVPIDGGADRTV